MIINYCLKKGNSDSEKSYIIKVTEAIYRFITIKNNVQWVKFKRNISKLNWIFLASRLFYIGFKIEVNNIVRNKILEQYNYISLDLPHIELQIKERKLTNISQMMNFKPWPEIKRNKLIIIGCFQYNFTILTIYWKCLLFIKQTA